jgi:DNA relaxase NicK
MARISSYDLDSTVTADDKLLGTDSVTGQTKNFTLSSFSTLVSSTINVPGEDEVDSYVHEQNSPSAVWTINHNLSKYPSIVLVDSEDDVIYGEVNYDSNNTIIITLSAAISGKAFLN